MIYPWLPSYCTALSLPVVIKYFQTNNSRHCLASWLTTKVFSQRWWEQGWMWWSRTSPRAGTSLGQCSSPRQSWPPLDMVTLLRSPCQVLTMSQCVTLTVTMSPAQVVGSAWAMPLLASPCVSQSWLTLGRSWQQSSTRWWNSTKRSSRLSYSNTKFLLKRKSKTSHHDLIFVLTSLNVGRRRRVGKEMKKQEKRRRKLKRKKRRMKMRMMMEGACLVTSRQLSSVFSSSQLSSPWGLPSSVPAKTWLSLMDSTSVS